MLEENSQDKVVLVVLVLTQGYVLQMNADKSKIISALQCHYDMQFEIIRKPSQVRFKASRYPTGSGMWSESALCIENVRTSWCSSW